MFFESKFLARFRPMKPVPPVMSALVNANPAVYYFLALYFPWFENVPAVKENSWFVHCCNQVLHIKAFVLCMVVRNNNTIRAPKPFLNTFGRLCPQLFDFIIRNNKILPLEIFVSPAFQLLYKWNCQRTPCIACFRISLECKSHDTNL